MTQRNTRIAIAAGAIVVLIGAIVLLQRGTAKSPKAADETASPQATVTEESMSAAYQNAVENGYIGSETLYLASLAGETYPDRMPADSSFEQAKKYGYTGNESEWIRALVEAASDTTVKTSVYAIAVENGFEGTLAAWLDDIRSKAEENETQEENEIVGYAVGKQNGYFGTQSEWLAYLPDPKGLPGIGGEQDLSAYDAAVANGYKGSVQEYMELLVSESVDAEKNSYLLAKDSGYTGSEEVWTAALSGRPGKTAFEIVQEDGYSGTMLAWLSALAAETDVDGRTSYEAAKENGYTQSEQEWLQALTGAEIAESDLGKSGYSIAVQEGYSGELSDWMETLVGPITEGGSVYQEAVKNGFEGTVQDWIVKILKDRDVDGNSLYQSGVQKGYEGTLDEWIPEVLEPQQSQQEQQSQQTQNEGKEKTDPNHVSGVVIDPDTGASVITYGNGNSTIGDPNGYIPVDETPSYLVLFKDYDETRILKAIQVREGMAANPPDDPVREGYRFTGWDKDFSKVESELTVIATYEKTDESDEYCTVTFNNYDGSELKKATVVKGTGAEAPTDPVRSGFVFVGWDTDFSNVAEDMIVTAQFTESEDQMLMMDSDHVVYDPDGHTLQVDIRILNNPGLASLRCYVMFNEQMTLKNVAFHSEFTEGGYAETSKNEDETYTNPLNILFISPLQDTSASGTLATLTFEVPKNIGDDFSTGLKLNYIQDETYDSDFYDVEFRVISETIKVTK